jgi:hypothetical protein
VAGDGGREWGAKALKNRNLKELCDLELKEPTTRSKKN